MNILKHLSLTNIVLALLGLQLVHTLYHEYTGRKLVDDIKPLLSKLQEKINEQTN